MKILHASPRGSSPPPHCSVECIIAASPVAGLSSLQSSPLCRRAVKSRNPDIRRSSLRGGLRLIPACRNLLFPLVMISSLRRLGHHSHKSNFLHQATVGMGICSAVQVQIAHFQRNRQKKNIVLRRDRKPLLTC